MDKIKLSLNWFHHAWWKPGKYHWLNWWSTLVFLIGGYVLFQVTQSCVALMDLRYQAMFGTAWPAYLADIMLLVAVVMVARWLFKKQAQQDVHLPTFTANRAIDYVAAGILSIMTADIVSFFIMRPFFSGVKTTSDNQSGLNALLLQGGPTTLLMVFTIVIMSPVVEELMFRYVLMGPKCVGVKQISPKRRLVYAVIAGIIFTMLHVQGEWETAWLDGFNNHLANLSLINNMINYGVIATALTTVYYKSGDIRYSMATHITWNIFTIIMQII